MKGKGRWAKVLFGLSGSSKLGLQNGALIGNVGPEASGLLTVVPGSWKWGGVRGGV